MTVRQGSLHPITQYMRRSLAFFLERGFEVVDSPEITTERHNFDDLRIPADHPARTMHDTFWLTDGRLPRTHTSAYQIPAMKGRTPPVRLVIPGRVFRNEATDATHETNFFQLEGLVVGESVSLAELKGMLTDFISHMYGSDTETLFVPAYFPFVEPGLEMHARIKGAWVEMLGAGMIHPGVLERMGLDPNTVQGFAFGMGIDRFAMMAHGVDDVRQFYGGSLRFLNQFKGDA